MRRFVFGRMMHPATLSVNVTKSGLSKLVYRLLVIPFLIACVVTAFFLFWIAVRALVAQRFDQAESMRILGTLLILVAASSGLLWRQLRNNQKTYFYGSERARFFAVVFALCAALAAVLFLPRVDLGSLGLAKKSLWDWLDLLFVPIVLLFGGYLLNRAQRARELEIDNQRAQGEALQAYLDKMGEWLLEYEMREAPEGAEVRTLARVRTLATLEELSRGRFSARLRKRRLLQFLTRTGLVEKNHPIIKLNGANLTGADLHNAALSDKDLSNTYMSYADLTSAKLENANLYNSDLDHALLRNAKLCGASLVQVDLTGADLTGADLSHADLTNARGVTKEQAKQASSLEGTTMPDGQKYEEWVESKGAGTIGRTLTLLSGTNDLARMRCRRSSQNADYPKLGRWSSLY
jgi:uncharacterized protein YjbI with pentapeptide repeats